VADAGHRLVAWGSFIGWLFTCVLAVLVFLSLPALQNSNVPSPAIPHPASDWAADFPDRVDRVTAALSQLALPLPTPTTVQQGAGAIRWLLRRYEATVPKPRDPDQVTKLFAATTGSAAGVTVGVAPDKDGATIKIGIDGLLTHSIALHWLAHNPQIAIVVADLGDNLLMARTAADIDAPLTFAIRPFRPFSKEVAQLVALFHREALLQLAAEADNERSEAGSPRLTAKADRATMQRWLGQNLAAVPNAIGFYGLGPLTEGTPERMQSMLAEAKERHFLIVTYGNTPDHGTCQAAASLGLACAARVSLVDSSENLGQMRHQLDAVLDQARTRGAAIAIVHATESSLAALRDALPSFTEAGVDIVPVSAVIRDISQL
jgi:polysaccharide deacetylase 2 family uncharacterized protein YibQ